MLALACAGGEGADDSQFTSYTGGNGSDDLGTEVGSEDATTDATSSTSDTDGNDANDTEDTDPTNPTTTTNSTNSDTTDATSDTGECGMTEQVGESCGQGSAEKGPVAIGESLVDLPVGVIGGLDNGVGNGAEDWYQFEFPIDPANPRPHAGMPTITLALNENSDYRFEVYRDCGAEPYGQGLAADFGASAPPLDEWSFADLDPGPVEQLDYSEMTLWPTLVWVRVFRFQNDGDCSSYQLLVTR
jgi:hypothetical protein